MAEVELRKVKKTFLESKVAALREIDLKVGDGTFTTVLGPSGCGKTTLLRIVAGLERPEEGDVLIGGKVVNDMPSKDRNIAMVFQNYALYPHKKVSQNISIGLKLRRLPKDEIERRVEEVSKMLNIRELLERYPRQLSGGQQQRVALARTLVREPDVFLLDEPLSNLDAQVRESTRTELKKLFKGIHSTVLYVTHDQTEAMMLSDLLVVMENGAIRQIGEPGIIYRDPNHRFVAEFIGTHRINMLPGRMERGRFISEDGAIVVSTNLKNGGQVLLGIRPEHLSIGGEKEVRLRGDVVLVEPLGENSLVSVRVGGNEIRTLSHEIPAPHESISLSLSPKEAYIFEKQTGLRLRN